MSPFGDTVRRIKRDLDAAGVRWAVVGGLAVSVRAYPRFTNDVDIAVAVASDAEAERLVSVLLARGYEAFAQLERDDGRLATIRMVCPPIRDTRFILDLLFASSGIESDVAAEAEVIDVFPGLKAPVARPGHLVVMKLIAVGENREHDDRDLLKLLEDISEEELDRVHVGIALVNDRGTGRGRDLTLMLETYLARIRPQDP